MSSSSCLALFLLRGAVEAAAFLSFGLAVVRPRQRCNGVGTRSTGGSGDGATGRDAETHFQSFGDGKAEEG